MSCRAKATVQTMVSVPRARACCLQCTRATSCVWQTQNGGYRSCAERAQAQQSCEVAACRMRNLFLTCMFCWHRGSSCRYWLHCHCWPWNAARYGRRPLSRSVPPCGGAAAARLSSFHRRTVFECKQHVAAYCTVQASCLPACGCAEHLQDSRLPPQYC